MASSKRNHKEKTVRRKEEKVEEPENPKYRDRAKERREDQNPDYEPSELGSFHAVAPPGNVDLLSADAHRISIEKSKYLGVADQDKFEPSLHCCYYTATSVRP